MMRRPSFLPAYALIPLFLLFFFSPSFAQWTPIASPGGESVYQVLHADNAWISLSESGIYRSTDDGRSWQISFLLTDAYNNIIAYHAADHTIWSLSEEQGVHRSADDGVTWQSLPGITFSNNYPGKTVFTDNFLFYRAYNRIYRVDLANPGPSEPIFQGKIFPSVGIGPDIAVRGNDLWVSSNDSLLRSSDGGNTWSLIHQQPNIYNFDVHDDVLLLYSADGMQRSTDYGSNWQNITGVPAVRLLKWSDGVWFARGDNAPLEFSADNGLSWQIGSADFEPSYPIYDVAKNDNTLLLCMSGFGLTRSADQGTNWQVCTSGMAIDNPSGGINFGVPQLYDVGNYLTVGQYFSADGGNLWFQPILSATDNYYYSFGSNATYYNGTYFLVGYSRQLYRSEGDMEHWETVGAPFGQNTSHQLLVANGHFYRIETTSSSNSKLVYETFDEGTTWVLNGLINNSSSPLTSLHNRLFYWNAALGLFRSGDGGVTWQSVGAGLGDFLNGNSFQETKMLAAGDLLFVYSNYGIMASTNEGLTFTKINTTLLSDFGYPMGAEALASDGTHVAVIAAGSIYYSIGLNNEWVKINANLPNIYDANLHFHDDYLYVNLSYQANPFWRRALHSINIAQISGRVWRDDNNNGQQDAGEPPYAGAIVQAGSGSFATSAADGTYTWLADLDNDTLRVHLPVPWAMSNPGFYQVNTSISSRDFGLYFPPNITDLSIQQTNVQVFRPGFDEKIHLTYHNLGTATADGSLRFAASSPLEFVAADPMPDAITGDTLRWNLTGLAPFSEGKIIVTLHTPASVPIATQVFTWASITPTQPDANPADNEHRLQEWVLGSFDPNDKRSDHDRISPDQITAGEPIVYTVRFQNTGTYPADFVRITDTLNMEHLDVSTFRVLASSHPCQTKLSGAGNLEFFFANIELPPSDFDEPASHGFVQYEVRPKASLPLGTNITNTAFIYFDFNSPIITNTTATTVEFPVLVREPSTIGRLQLRPNPASDYVEVKLEQSETGQLRIINAFGQVVVRQSTTGEKTRLELAALAPGFYTVEWQNNSNGSRRIGRLIKQ